MTNSGNSPPSFFPHPLKLPTCSQTHTHTHHPNIYPHSQLRQTQTHQSLSEIQNHTSTQYMCTLTHVLNHMYSDIYTHTVHTYITSSSTYTWPLTHSALLTSPFQSLMTSQRGHSDVFRKTAWTSGYSQQKIFLNCKLPCDWFFVFAIPNSTRCLLSQPGPTAYHMVLPFASESLLWCDIMG